MLHSGTSKRTSEGRRCLRLRTVWALRVLRGFLRDGLRVLRSSGGGRGRGLRT